MKVFTHTTLGHLKRNRSKFILLSILAMSVLTHSCYKDRLGLDNIAGGKWSPELAAPIAYADLTMDYMIRDSKETWKEYPDGLLSLIYRQDAISDIAADVIEFPNQHSDTIVQFNMNPNMQVGDSAFKYVVFNTEFAANNGERLDSILIKDGFVDLEIVTNLNHDGYLELTIPSLTRYGVTFVKKLEFKYTGGSSTTVKATVDLSDYYLTLENTGGVHNHVKEYVKVSATKLNTPDNSPYTFELNQDIRDLTYYLAMGYFHQHATNIDETSIPIDLFDNQTAGSIFMEDPHMYITLRNTYGLPSAITFDELYAERDGVKLNITSTLLPTLNINYPSYANIGGYDTTIYHFNIGNSNIKDVIAMNPKKLVFKGIVNTNPQGTPIENFVLDTSHITVDVEVEIPLHGRAISFELRDTTDISGGSTIDNTTNVKSLTLNVNSDNGFPVDVLVQIYMTDTLNNIIDSVFQSDGHIVAAAPVGAAPDYRVSSKQHNLAKIELNEKQIDNYNKADRLIISAKATTIDAGQKVVKIYSDYSVYIEVSAKAVIETDF